MLTYDDERLRCLLDDLAANGFQITPDQRVRVTGLLVGLQLSGAMPYQYYRLGNMLGAIVCRSAQEQHDFHQIFRYWFPEELARGNLGTGSDNDNPAEYWQQLKEERRAFEEEVQRRLRAAQLREFKRQLRALVPIVLVVFVLAVVLQILLGQFFPQQKLRSDIRTATSPKEVPQRDPFQPTLSSRVLEQLEDGLGGLADWLVIVERTLGPLTTLFLMIPLGLVALLVASSRKLISAYARQTHILARNEFRRVLSQGEHGLEFVGNQFFHAIQPMRRRIELPSDEIAVDQTIEATMRAGGYFSPVYAKRRASPEYVVLIDRRYSGDHLAQYSCTLVDAMERAGVHVLIYYFDRDPRRSTLGPGQRILDLDDLAIMQSSHRMLLFSDGSGLFDMTTGWLQPWATRFAAWPYAVLLTPKHIADWGRPEWLIESVLGMPVLPATEAGLLVAAQLFDIELPSIAPTLHRPSALMPDYNRLDGFFAVGAWRWIDEIEPPTEAVDDLVERLRAELSAAAFDWLRALAVYPAIYWNLTLFLGSKLAGMDGKLLFAAGSMLEIARLPWLQHGHMPDWLRKRFIFDMASELRQRLRGVLEELLLTVVSRDPKDFTLTLDLSAGEEARHTAEGLNADERRQDTILVDFMTRREASPTDFRLRSKVANALGLPRARSVFHTLFDRSDLEAMRAAAEDLTRFIKETPLVEVQTQSVHPREFGPGVREITDYRTTSRERVALLRPLYLLKRNPNKPFAILLDQYAISLWARRKRLTLRFSMWSLGLLSAVLGLVYASFFDMLEGGAGLFIAAIIYAPFLIFWLLLLRPYSKVLRHFPHVTDGQIQFQWVSRRR
jgi:hypothetical protein